MPTPRFTVVVPCFNEQGAIRETIDTLRKILDGAGPYEFIIVNDGSNDDTGRILEEYAEYDPGLTVIQNATNRGYGASLKIGIRRSSAEFIVITDADGTYPDDRIPELLERAREVDMVVGARTYKNVPYSFMRRIPKSFLRWYVCWLVGENVPDMNSGLRVLRRSVAEKFLKILPDSFSFTTTITLAMMRNGHEVVFVPISYAQRAGKSKIRPIRDTIRFTHLIVRSGMYFAPLRVLTPLIVLLLIAFLFSLGRDIRESNLADATVLLFTAVVNTTMFALLADMIDKRTGG